jgi:spore germination protein GerM
MPRHIKLGLIFFGLVLVLGISYYYNLQKRVGRLVRPPQEPSQPYLVDKPVFSETAPLKKVRVFLPSKSKDGLLEPEEREIHSSDQVSAEAKQIIAELIAGSKEGRGAAIPPETKLREIFISGEALAVVDLTKEVSANHPGGLIQEVSSIYAIVNSLTENLPSIRRVQILVEGAEAETLAGHIDLSKPLRQDLSMTPFHETTSKGIREEVIDDTSFREAPGK